MKIGYLRNMMYVAHHIHEGVVLVDIDPSFAFNYLYASGYLMSDMQIVNGVGHYLFCHDCSIAELIVECGRVILKVSKKLK